jgi:hypothetical protein
MTLYTRPEFPGLQYNSETGEFTWSKARKGARSNRPAGTNNRGYTQITYNYQPYSAHRLAWFFVYGVWPRDMIDHINRVRSDNRIENLREADNQVNQRNAKINSRNTSGHRGVYWHIGKKKWYASIRVNNKQVHIGSYGCITAAMFARKISEQFYEWKGE